MVEEFLERLAAKLRPKKLRPKLKPWHHGDPTKHLTYRKYNVLLKKLVE